MHKADVLVVALGADYDLEATPGLAEGANEFYSVGGAARLRELLPSFSQGRAIVGVCGAPFKYPPAPSEAVLLLHDHLTARGVRGDCEISLVMPFDTRFRRRQIHPVLCSPPLPKGESRSSPAAPSALSTRPVTWRCSRTGTELPYDLFLGVPKRGAPDVVLSSGMAEDGYVPVDSATLATRFPGVYAVGDVATVGVPKAGVFSEGAARVVAASLIATARGTAQPEPFDGRGGCTSSSGPDGSAGSTSTSSRARSRPGRSRSRPPSSSPRRPCSAPIAGPAEFGRCAGAVGEECCDPRRQSLPRAGVRCSCRRRRRANVNVGAVEGVGPRGPRRPRRCSRQSARLPHQPRPSRRCGPYPYVAGEGTPAVRRRDPRSYRLDLVSSTASSRGIIELQYQRHR